MMQKVKNKREQNKSLSSLSTVSKPWNNTTQQKKANQKVGPTSSQKQSNYNNTTPNNKEDTFQPKQAVKIIGSLQLIMQTLCLRNAFQNLKDNWLGYRIKKYSFAKEGQKHISYQMTNFDIINEVIDKENKQSMQVTDFLKQSRQALVEIDKNESEEIQNKIKLFLGHDLINIPEGNNTRTRTEVDEYSSLYIRENTQNQSHSTIQTFTPSKNTKGSLSTKQLKIQNIPTKQSWRSPLSKSPRQVLRRSSLCSSGRQNSFSKEKLLKRDESKYKSNLFEPDKQQQQLQEIERESEKQRELKQKQNILIKNQREKAKQFIQKLGAQLSRRKILGYLRQLYEKRISQQEQIKRTHFQLIGKTFLKELQKSYAQKIFKLKVFKDQKLLYEKRTHFFNWYSFTLKNQSKQKKLFNEMINEFRKVLSYILIIYLNRLSFIVRYFEHSKYTLSRIIRK